MLPAGCGKAGCGDGCVEIEFTEIGPWRAGNVHVDEQIAEGLIRHLACGPRDQAFVGKRFGFGKAALCDQLADVLDRLRTSLGVQRFIRAATPQCVLVQLYPFRRDAAEDHCTEPTIADR